jgi:hypothetical protein
VYLMGIFAAQTAAAAAVADGRCAPACTTGAAGYQYGQSKWKGSTKPGEPSTGTAASRSAQAAAGGPEGRGSLMMGSLYRRRNARGGDGSGRIKARFGIKFGSAWSPFVSRRCLGNESWD